MEEQVRANAAVISAREDRIRAAPFNDRNWVATDFPQDSYQLPALKKQGDFAELIFDPTVSIVDIFLSFMKPDLMKKLWESREPDYLMFRETSPSHGGLLEGGNFNEFNTLIY